MLLQKWKGNLEIYFNIVPNYYIYPKLQWSATLIDYLQMRKIHYFIIQPHLKNKNRSKNKTQFRKLFFFFRNVY